jgi:hypothetical protein
MRKNSVLSGCVNWGPLKRNKSEKKRFRFRIQDWLLTCDEQDIENNISFLKETFLYIRCSTHGLTNFQICLNQSDCFDNQKLQGNKTRHILIGKQIHYNFEFGFENSWNNVVRSSIRLVPMY